MYPKKYQKIVLLRMDGQKEIEHQVKVIDVTETSIITEPPNDKNGYPMMLPVGETVRLVYSDKGALYNAELQVSSHIIETVSLIVFPLPSEDKIRKLNRRRYFRVPTTIPVIVAIEKSAERRAMVDISGGGFAFETTNQAFKQDVQVTGEFRIGNATTLIRFNGIVRRTTQKEDSPGTITVGVEFLGLSDKEQQVIIKYCNDRQLQLRRTATQ